MVYGQKGLPSRPTNSSNPSPLVHETTHAPTPTRNPHLSRPSTLGQAQLSSHPNATTRHTPTPYPPNSDLRPGARAAGRSSRGRSKDQRPPKTRHLTNPTPQNRRRPGTLPANTLPTTTNATPGRRARPPSKQSHTPDCCHTQPTAMHTHTADLPPEPGSHLGQRADHCNQEL